MGKFGVHIGLLLATLIGVIGCFEIVEPTPPPPDGVDSDSDSNTDDMEGCRCDNSDVAGHVFRFTSLVAEKPTATKTSLDNIWKHELKNYLLNVLFFMDEVDPSDNADEAFSSIAMTAGSGWRYPVTGGYYYEDLEEIETYCFLQDELNVEVALRPTGDDACTFTNDDEKTLYFHIGSMEEPLECAPELGPADSTPLHNLTVTFGFDASCDHIVNGYLEGCLPGHAVDRICMCTPTGTCGRENPDEDLAFPEMDSEGNYEDGALLAYCPARCGGGQDMPNYWVSFRNIMDIAGEKDCETEEGEPGYTLAARFEAEDVTSLFSTNPQDCTDGKK
ncbi:MAG: hypothetical protein JXX14_20020 [Deltaproteobacteria bacterium]|nr:hypothetical protein [Deltaproteobacteria bacterium]